MYFIFLIFFVFDTGWWVSFDFFSFPLLSNGYFTIFLFLMMYRSSSAQIINEKARLIKEARLGNRRSAVHSEQINSERIHSERIPSLRSTSSTSAASMQSAIPSKTMLFANMFRSSVADSVVMDTPMSGTNVNSDIISSVYGIFCAEIKKLFPEASMETILQKYPHPVMCVVGCESTGKSSTIENITKVPLFPTDTDVCTRCPIRVIMRPVMNGVESRYSLKAYGKEEVRSFNDSNCHEIKNVISTIFEEIRATNTIGYSKDEITVTIERENVICMDFVDLPGIVSYPLEAHQFTKELTNRYIVDTNSFIVCVANATVPRLTSYPPIGQIIDANASDRTIVVLTMVDKLSEADFETHLLNRILQSTNEFQDKTFVACCAIINRSNSYHHVSLVDYEIIEKNWFQNNIISRVDSGLEICKGNCAPEDHIVAMKKTGDQIRQSIGIHNLLLIAKAEYEGYVRDKWIPSTLAETETNRKKTLCEMAELGDPVTPLNVDQFSKVLDFSINQRVRSIAIEFCCPYKSSPELPFVPVSCLQTISWETFMQQIGDMWKFSDIELQKRYNHNNSNYLLTQYKKVSGSIKHIELDRFSSLNEKLKVSLLNFLNANFASYHTLFFHEIVYPQPIYYPCSSSLKPPTPQLRAAFDHALQNWCTRYVPVIVGDVSNYEENEDTFKKRRHLSDQLSMYAEVITALNNV